MTYHILLSPLATVPRQVRLSALAALFVCCFLLVGGFSALKAQDAGTLLHTVQTGETLSEIAAQYGVDAAILLEVNSLDDADAIYAGQRLRIPVTATSADAPAPPGTHRVQGGETLSAIAQRYGMSLEELLALNQLDNADAVFAGQLLAIGTATGAAPDAEAGGSGQAAGEADTSTTTSVSEDAAQLIDAAAEEQANDPTPEPAAEDEGEETAALPESHTVRPGETLTGIARRYGIPAATLKALNNLGDADFIVVGQRLILSVAVMEEEATPAPTEVSAAVTETATETPAAATPATPETTPEATAPPASAVVPPSHTVAPGETLSGIARRYGVGLGTILALNKIQDENSIYVGQVLLLLAPTPEPTAGPPPTPAGAAPEDAADGSQDAAPADSSEASALSAAEGAAAGEPSPIVRSGSPIASLNRIYTIRFGDTLPRIALREGVDADALTSLNGFDSVNAPLSAGQTLLLPATGDELRPTTPAQEHSVAPGESLSGIAQAYGTTTTDLMAANNISDPNALFSGQRLLIPSLSLGGSGAVLQQIGPASSGYFFYTVQPGDTLSAIAKQFDSTMEALRTYNGLPDNETVYTGLELKIPFGPPSLPINLPPVPMSGTRFVVSLSRQQCWVFEGDKVRYAWNCSTGQADRKTKPGNYAVQSKIANAKSKVWRLDMPYWLGIYDVGEVENGIHGLPMSWSTGKKIWSGLIGQPATFGCAMLDDANASTLFRMAFLGMPVHVVN